MTTPPITDAKRWVQVDLPTHLTNEELRVMLDRMKSEEPFPVHEWPEWLYEHLQEWFTERNET